MLDDDDAYMPTKIARQVAQLNSSTQNVHFSASEALFGNGFYNRSLVYPKYNAGHFKSTLKYLFKKHFTLDDENLFPEKVTKELLAVHNYIITSTVCFTRSILNVAGPFAGAGLDDYRCACVRLCVNRAISLSSLSIFPPDPPSLILAARVPQYVETNGKSKRWHDLHHGSSGVL